ncbi:MAG TPA: ORF6N domain-containing protein [Candidatus Omnitrophota bacterium]|nr:ORF6N domain-containing protein [Candidatus Omnitrophota bacterium]
MPKQDIRKNAVPIEIIQSKIYLIRGHKVIFDFDLALLYGVETRALIQAVKRNLRRFPVDFMFRILPEERDSLTSQIVMSNKGRGGRRHQPYVFTQEGVAMLSSVLNSDRAVQVNIQIMRVFVKLRELILSHKDLARKIEDLERKFGEHDAKIIHIFNEIRRLMAVPEPLDNYKRTKVGFVVN